MRKSLFILLCCIAFSIKLHATETVTLTKARYHHGDNMEWRNPSFDDSNWELLDISAPDANIRKRATFGWFRMHFNLKEAYCKTDLRNKELICYINVIEDADEVYLNGNLVWKSNNMPNSNKEAKVVENTISKSRKYTLPVTESSINTEGDNVLAIRVWNAGSTGGIFNSTVRIDLADGVDALEVQTDWEQKEADSYAVTLDNKAHVKQQGVLQVTLTNTESGETIKEQKNKVRIAPGKTFTAKYNYPDAFTRYRVGLCYTDEFSGKQLNKEYITPYILTPKPSDKPVINSAAIYGVRPGSPILYKIAATGKAPMRYAVKGLPDGLAFNEEKGIISGSLSQRGDYNVTIQAFNELATTEKQLIIRVGDAFALTPPLGWNSWNCWGKAVTQKRAISSAQALIDKGLINYGWSYINIDDAWPAPQRNADGTIEANKETFPDMKGLGDWLHGEGLKLGIYSSPGPFTCGRFLGSYQHEEQDAQTFASWGVDYLKYDWCSYWDIHTQEGDNSLYAHIKPFQKMQHALRATNRDIFYNLCEYGDMDVWQWGRAVDAQSWRTTGDIVDTWQSLYNIGFVRQKDLYPFAGPGYWNDPDMLIVGKLGWGSLRPTRLTPDEQYTHISLWCIYAAPLLIGCDISQIDDFTLNLLTNSEVLAVDQDPLGKQGKQALVDGELQLWTKEMQDGSLVVGLFNLSEKDCTVNALKYANGLGIESATRLRDLWRQRDITPESLNNVMVPSHGVKLVRIFR